MDRKPFEPIGERPRWEIVYDVLTAAKVGDVITYTALGDALGLDPDTERGTIQAAMHQASKRHEERDKRATDAVRNEGYRIVQAPEQLGLARRQQRKASKALQRGHSKAVNVDFNGLPAEVRHAFEIVGQAFALQMDFNRRFDVKQKHLEKAVADVTDRTARSEGEIAELRERLLRLEKDAS